MVMMNGLIKMRNNITLKQAVITALAALVIGAQHNAYALGLGNISVKSHLGQPLRASIKIQGASELKGEACFSVINDSSVENPIVSANFKLSKIVGDAATLSVTTHQIINDPITNLIIMAECDANIRREYVLLLDPPTVEEPSQNAETEHIMAEEAALLDDSKQAVREIDAPSVQAQTVKTAATSTKKSSAKKHKKANKNANKNVVLTAGYHDEKVTTKPSASAKLDAIDSKPRLSISGGEALSKPQNSANLNLANSNLTNSNSANLRLDRQLHFTAEAAPEGAIASIEMQDEATVLNNRMLHLEKQISNLVLANQKLKAENILAENKVKAQQLEQANSSSNKLDWLGYILGGGLLLSGLTIAEKLRTRHQIQKLEDAELAFLSPNQTANNPANFEEFKTNDDYFGPLTKQGFSSTVDNSDDQSSSFEPTQVIESTFSVDEFDAEHNILDHADVFLSHGRTSLAIQLLQNHLLDFPKKSVTIWLFLLDLLAKENMHGVYEQTALECKEHFNIRIAAFSNDEASPKQHFEDFPRLNTGLQDVWGTPAALVYLDDLIYNSRLETRAGFDKNVLEELLLLKSIAQELASTATIIQLDEKKLALKTLKDAQIAAKKAEKLLLMDELPLLADSKDLAQMELEPKETMFEFNLAEFK